MNEIQRYVAKTYQYEKPFDFSKHTSIGCGGKAKVALFPKNKQEMLAMVRDLYDDGVPFIVLGNMTNVLPPEGYLDKVVLCTHLLKGHHRDGESMYFAAGTSSGEILRYAKQEQLSGCEFLDGIPCSVGGAVYMNAGVQGRYMADCIQSVEVIRDGAYRTLPLSACAYGYKQSVFMQNHDIIVGATLQLHVASEKEIEEKRSYYQARRIHLPKGKSMGCVFKNPQGQSAGKLIEGAGLKGLRIGGAVVSSQHANFIINDARATSQDVQSLIQIIKNAVFAQYKIRLKEEIKILS